MISHCRPSSLARQMAEGPFVCHDARLIEAPRAFSASAMALRLGARPHPLHAKAWQQRSPGGWQEPYHDA
eukprot:5487898-Alexandrium_andersonii.AAC.1